MKFLLFLYDTRVISVQYFFKRTFNRYSKHHVAFFLFLYISLLFFVFFFLLKLLSLGLRNWICRNQRKTATVCRRKFRLFWQKAKRLTINLTYRFLPWIFGTPQAAWCTECRTSYGSPWLLTEPRKQRHILPSPIRLREWFWCSMRRRICFALWIAVVGLSPRCLILKNSWLNEKVRINDGQSNK